MPPKKRKAGPGISYAKTKRRRSSKPFEGDRISALQKSDLGSYYDQPKLWPEEFKQSETNQDTVSASTKKIEVRPVSTATTNKNNKTSCKWIQPGLSIVDGSQLQRGIEMSSCCKFCSGGLEIVEDIESRHGLGSVWELRCKNEECE